MSFFASATTTTVSKHTENKMLNVDPLAEAARLLSKPNLDKETTARINSLISLDEAQARRNTLAKHSRELGLPEYQSFDEHGTAFRAYLSAGKTAITTGAVDKKYLTGYTGERD